MSAKRNASRRDFLKQCFTGAAVLRASGSMGLLASAQQAASAKSRVVIARDDLLRGTGSTVDSRRMLGLLDRAMQTLFDRDHAVEAWSKLVRPGETVGLKVNALGGRGLSSNLQLVEAICERLQEAGIKAGDIVVWDRETDEMERAGFRICRWAETAFNASAPIAWITSRIWLRMAVSGSRLSRILTQRCNVLINLPVLKDHDGAGVTIALKNMYGVIHNPNKYHPNGCDPYIADLNMLPEIRTRMRLTICDATTAQYEGGPAYKPEYSWKHNALIVSQDPVALDYTGWQIIERKRAEKGLKTLEAEGRAPHYIATAADAEHRLGTNDPGRITVVEV